MSTPDQDISVAQQTGLQRLQEQVRWLDSLPGDIQTILDIGCGAGHHSKYFKDRGMKPTGLDLFPDAFLYRDEIPFLNCDYKDLADQSFDAVFASHVLEHCPNTFDTLMAWRRKITPAGYLIVIVPTYAPVFCNDHWVTGWNIGQLAAMLVAAGFDCSQSVFVQTGIHVCGYGRKREFSPTRMNVPATLPYLPKGLRDRFYVDGPNEFVEAGLARADTRISTVPISVTTVSNSAFRFSLAAHVAFDGGGWASVERRLTPGEHIDMSKSQYSLIALLEGPECPMRLAIGADRGSTEFEACAEIWHSFAPGLNCLRFHAYDLTVLRGAPDFSRVSHISFGGPGSASKVWVWLFDGTGTNLL
jgi:SAM-dependent methyltransferase